MNITELSDSLQRLNWDLLPRPDKSDVWLRFGDVFAYVETRFSIKLLGDSVSIRTLNNFCYKEHHETAMEIHNITPSEYDLSSYMYRNSKRVKLPKTTGSGPAAQSITESTETILQSFDYTSFLDKCLSNRPDIGLDHQMNHITALAIKGEYKTLMDYVDYFKEGNKLNFLEPVTLEIIDRALAISLRNSDL